MSSQQQRTTVPPIRMMNNHGSSMTHTKHLHLSNPSQSMTTIHSSSVVAPNNNNIILNNNNNRNTNGGGGTNNNSSSGSTMMMMMMDNPNHPYNNHRSQPYTTKLNKMNVCGICSEYDLQSEVLEYDYSLEQRQYASSTETTTSKGTIGTSTGTNNKSKQPYPRIRTRGEYYIDTFNEEPWSWTMGTNEHNGTWCNSSDQAGTIMSAMVWILMLYSAFTVTALTITNGIPVTLGMLYSILVFMSLASHAKTSFTDPGSVPIQAIPNEKQRLLRDSHSMCGQCQTFKPPGSHHCRICNRCISHMDHHCPWMNNCVGIYNLKHFILFLIYTWTCSTYSLLLFGYNYFFCTNEQCMYHPLVLHLVRLMTLLAIGAFLFTSSMLMNVCYGIMTGIGTIDRLKKKATNTMNTSDEEPILLVNIFGIGGYWTWPLPIDPLFYDNDSVIGYTMPNRLDRERQFCELVYLEQQQQLLVGGGGGELNNNNPTTTTAPGGGHTIKPNPSVEFPTNKCVSDLLPV